MREKHFFKNFKMSYLRVKKLRKIGKTVITEMELHGLFSLVRYQLVRSKYTNKHLNTLFILLIPFICFFIHVTVCACTFSLLKLKWNLTKPCYPKYLHTLSWVCVLGQRGLVSHVSQEARCSVINNSSFRLYLAL